MPLTDRLEKKPTTTGKKKEQNAHFSKSRKGTNQDQKYTVF